MTFMPENWQEEIAKYGQKDADSDNEKRNLLLLVGGAFAVLFFWMRKGKK